MTQASLGIPVLDLVIIIVYMLGILAIAVLWMGVYPKPFTDVMQVSVSELLKHVAMSKIN